MSFQSYANSVRSRYSLTRIPLPLAGGVAVLLVLVVAWGLSSFVLAPSSGEGFEIVATESGSEPASGEESKSDAVAAGEDSTQGADSASQNNAAAGSDTSAQSTQGTASIGVHLDGEVKNPGVYYVSAGSRLIDVVEAAGGLTSEAASSSINLAQLVQDGEQFVVPNKNDVAAGVSTGVSAGSSASSSGMAGDLSGSSAASNGLVNINTASAAELMSLNGIGEATAQKIIADREKNGPFSSVDDLTRVSGIGEKKLAALRESICV